MISALNKLKSKNYLKVLKSMKNPYGDGKAGSKIAKNILKIKIDSKLLKKRFISL